MSTTEEYRYDGTTAEDYHYLQRLVAETEVGKQVALDFIRKGEGRRPFNLQIGNLCQGLVICAHASKGDQRCQPETSA